MPPPDGRPAGRQEPARPNAGAALGTVRSARRKARGRWPAGGQCSRGV